MKVYDNFLNERYHREILELMGGPSFNWYYGNNITGIPSPDGKSHLRGTDTISDLDEHGFSHPFWVAGWPPQSEHTSFIMPFYFLKLLLIQIRFLCLLGECPVCITSPGYTARRFAFGSTCQSALTVFPSLSFT